MSPLNSCSLSIWSSLPAPLLINLLNIISATWIDMGLGIHWSVVNLSVTTPPREKWFFLPLAWVLGALPIHARILTDLILRSYAGNCKFLLSTLCVIALVVLILSNLMVKVKTPHHWQARDRRRCFLTVCTEKVGAIWSVPSCWSWTAATPPEAPGWGKLMHCIPLGEGEKRGRKRGVEFKAICFIFPPLIEVTSSGGLIPFFSQRTWSPASATRASHVSCLHLNVNSV